MSRCEHIEETNIEANSEPPFSQYLFSSFSNFSFSLMRYSRNFPFSAFARFSAVHALALIAERGDGNRFPQSFVSSVKLKHCLIVGIRRNPMHQIIYLVGLIVVIMFILSILGLR